MILNRPIIHARRNVGEALTPPFRSLESVADDTAIQSLQFLALALEQRRLAALPVAAGTDALDLMFKACGHAYHAQALVRGAHALWPAIADDYGLFAPECPPKWAAMSPHLEVAA